MWLAHFFIFLFSGTAIVWISASFSTIIPTNEMQRIGLCTLWSTHTHTHSAGLMWLIWVNRAPDDVCALVSQWCVEQPQTDQSDERRPSRNQEGRRGGMSGKKLCNTSPSDVHALAFKQRFHTFKICMSLIQWSNVTQRHVPESGV